MGISRRSMLYGIGAGIISGAVLPSLSESDFLATSQPASNKQPGRPLRLDRNENAYGAPQGAILAMRESLTYANRYPDSSEALQEKLARLHRVKPDQIVLGCGSSEILRIAGEAFLGPGKKLIMATPSYPLLAYLGQLRGAEVVALPLTPERSHDLKAMLARSDTATGLVYICNPNNPTGTLTTRRDLDEFLAKLPPKIPVLIDEAYYHYVVATPSYVSFIDSPASNGRVIVARTFSKIYALAGLRIGYAVAPSDLASRLSQLRLQFGENSVAIPAAIAALDDTEHVRRCRQLNSDAQQTFYNECDKRLLGVSDSRTNFSLLQLDHPIDEVIAHFRRNNIIVGPRFPGIDKFLRVSMGRPEEMKEFWRVWDLLPHEMMMH
ncbi:MAG: histidinol-phosphate transaminase [Candidatus Angelobacter sp.]